MLVTEATESLPGGGSLLRNEPVQARSSARLTGLLDAAAAIIDEIGYERLTTAMVAERAGASIGTVYRYFPDRIAVVEALAVRCVQRLVDKVRARVDKEKGADWRAVVRILIDTKVEMYRGEPGFRSVGFGDSDTADRTGGSGDERHTLAAQIAAFLVREFHVAPSAEFDLAIEVATEIGNALVARAFLSDPKGDKRFIEQCHRVVAGHLETVVALVD